MADPRRGHHVINNGVKDIYRDIIQKFVNTYGAAYLGKNNYSNLIDMKIINKVQSGGLPVDCVLRAAPLTNQVRQNIESGTVYTPEGQTYTNYQNAETFGMAKAFLLSKVHLLMRDICHSLKNENKMPEDLNGKIAGVRTFIIKEFARDVYVDEQARGWWEEEHGPEQDNALEGWIQEVERMIDKIAGLQIQLVVHWGQWVFRVSEGLDYILSAKLDYTHI